MPSMLTALWGLSIVATAVAAWRLYKLDLHRVYSFFFAYLTFAAVSSLTLLLLPAGLRSNS